MVETTIFLVFLPQKYFSSFQCISLFQAYIKVHGTEKIVYDAVGHQIVCYN
jgi:hypothetical protein